MKVKKEMEKNIDENRLLLQKIFGILNIFCEFIIIKNNLFYIILLNIFIYVYAYLFYLF